VVVAYYQIFALVVNVLHGTRKREHSILDVSIIALPEPRGVIMGSDPK